MKKTKITSFFLVLVMMLTLLAQLAVPVSAVSAKELGISVKSSKYFDYSQKRYVMSFKVTLSDAEYHPTEDPVVKAYLYNSAGDCVMQWTNSGKGFKVEDKESTRKFNIDTSKLKNGKYTFRFYVCCEYFDDRWNLQTKNFYWKYTLDKADMVQSIKFKQMSYATDSKGRTVPRVNVTYKNLKGATITIRYYDKYDNVIAQTTSSKLKNDSGSTWFTWGGMADGAQFPDGTYKVKISTSNGLSITESFYFDFPGYNKK